MNKLHKDVQDASRAEEIINDPLVRMALDGMREQLKDGFSAQSRYNQEQSQEIWITLKVIDKFEQFLKATIDNGKLAEHELTRLSWIEKQKRKFK